MTDSFLTIEKKSEGIYKDKGSKFLAFAFHVENENEITSIIKELKKTYYDARHYVYAFRLGADKKNYRCNDDGEPSNSSGQPVLGQIKSFDLTDVLIVVVRYFGGTKLGVPGLINAYKTAAYEALNNAVIVEKTVDAIIEAKFEYRLMNDVMRIIKEENLKIEKQILELDCQMQLSIRKSNAEKVLEKIKNIRGVECYIV